MNSQGYQIVALFFVLNCNLDFGVRSHPLHDALLSAFLKTEHQLAAQTMGQWHVLFGLVGGVADHQALVSSPDILEFLVHVH